MSAVELFGTIYEKGDTIFEQGDVGDTLYIIQSGAVEISGRRGSEKIVLNLLEKGAFFGEMALIDQSPRSATTTAIARTRLLPIRRESFFDPSLLDTTVVFQLLKSLCRRIERTNGLLRELVAAYDDDHGAAADRLPAVAGIACGNGDDSSLPTVKAHNETTQRPLQAVAPDSIFARPDLQVCHFAGGETIFDEGDDGAAMYIVSQGAVEIFTEAAGKRIPLNRVGPGGFFGEMTLATGNPRTATAVAIDDTTLIAIGQAELTQVFELHPDIALFVIQVLIVRLRLNTAALEAPDRSVDVVREMLPPVINKQKKVRIAVVSLSSCGGCAAMLIQDRSVLAALTQAVDVVYCPMLMDAESFEDVDVALVDGIVRVKEDEDALMAARSKSRFLVAWGTCAVHGGIPAMANRFELEELLEESYGRTTDAFTYYLGGSAPGGKATTESRCGDLLRKARKLDDIVRVDYMLAGCPPNIGLLEGLLSELQGGSGPAPAKAVVCAECPRKAKKVDLKSMWTFPNGKNTGALCFLSQGALCLGLMTKGGCGAVCTSGGLPCWGCRGPTQKTLNEIGCGSYFEEVMASTIARRTKLDEQQLRAVVRILRNKGGSALSFENNFARNTSRLR